MLKGNLIILVTCQLISTTGTTVIVTLGGIIGSILTGNQALATLPVSMMVVGVAATTIPATMLMRKIGRSRGFAIASISAAAAVVVAVIAIINGSFLIFVIATTLFGINLAFSQQYRFAAAESVPSQYVPRAVSFVLLGSIGGAILGPELATRGELWIDAVPFSGTMLALAGLYVLQALLFLRLKGINESSDEASNENRRELKQIISQPVFLVAVLGGTVGWGIMTLVMTATPLSMHINDGFSLEQTAGVIRAHVLGMYVPSLISGFLIERFGVSRLMFSGALILLITSTVGLLGQTVLHYWWAMMLLGVGWNFLYVSGTTMLTYTYSTQERFRAQAVNEFLIFGTSATTSLLAGTIMFYFGWFRLMLVPIPLLILVCIAIIMVRRNPMLGWSVQTSES